MNTATRGLHTEPATGVMNRIRARVPEMSGTMRRIATFLLEHPQAPLEGSIGDLARASGTSAATVTRFCRLIGYTGYASFRVGIATEAGRTSSREIWTTDIGRAFGPDDSAAEVLSTLMNAHIRSLQETASVMDLALMKEISQRIAFSTHVDIYGVGGSAVLARELQARLYRIGINCHHWSEVHDGLTSAAIQNADCVAIGISNTGRTEETVQMLRQAQRAGALTVAISNNPASALVETADLQIITSVFERFLQPDDLSAKHVQLMVLDLLYLLIAQEDFERTTTNLATSALAVAAHRRGTRASARTAAAAPGVAMITDTRSGDSMPKFPTAKAMAERYAGEVSARIDALTEDARSGALDAAVDALVTAIDRGGVIQAFGTGHSEAFAMEIAGRAGGLIPTNKIALRDVVLHGSLGVESLAGSALERDGAVVDELFDITPIGPDDVFIIASNSGVNGSVVGLALLAKERGHTVIAVTSLQHTSRVEPKHPSGKRLSDVADVVIDNGAPFGDVTLELPGGMGVGAVSSITSAFIAQLLTIETSRRIAESGRTPPLYISANIPGGDDHNHSLEDVYRNQIRRDA